MEWYNKTLCVTFEDLTEGPYAIMSYEALRKLLQRYPHVRMNRGCRDKEVRIDYYALPTRYRREFESRLGGDPKEMIKKMEERVPLRLDCSARVKFAGYKYDKGTEKNVSLPDELIEEYTLNATVLNMLLGRYNDSRGYRNALRPGSGGLWDSIVRESERLREDYGHTLPANPARLKEKMHLYQKEGCLSLISKKVGNRNTTVIDGDAARCIIALKRSKVPVMTDVQILEEYNRRAAAAGWKQLKSVRALTLFLNRPEVAQLWYDARHGELKASQKYSHRLSTALPTRRDSLWYGDGTKLNLYYRATVDGRTVAKTMNVYEVIDAATEVMLGYHISEREDSEAQYHAYRMALDRSRHIPRELVCDNQGGHKKLESQEFFKRLCHIYRPTKPYNGSSKTIESLFGRFQAQVLSKSWFFTGQNITAKKASSRVNVEFIQANADKLPTLDEVKEIYAEYRREWNEKKDSETGLSRLDKYEASINEETQEVTDFDMVNIFWVFSKKLSTYTTSGIRITVNGKARDYEVYGSNGLVDRSFIRQHTNRRFKVQYDPADMRSVRLYTEDGRYIATAEAKIRIHRAIQDQTDGERAYIAAELRADEEARINRRAEAMAIELEHGTAPELFGLRREKMAGVNRGREATDRDIERKMKKYARLPIPENGRDVGKMISQAMIDPLNGEIEFDERRAVGKL